MNEESRTPPPSRLGGNGWSAPRADSASRQPSRFPGVVLQQPSTPPPSRLGGYTFTKAPQPRIRPSRRRRMVLVAIVAFIVLALGAGTLMVVAGNTPVAQDAPLPAVPDNIAPADQKPVGPDGIGAKPVDGQGPTADNPYPGAVRVENADTGGGDKGWLSPRYAVPVTIMSTELMEPMSVFVPAAKLYSLARPSDSFIPSKYAGFDSITIPDNPHRTVWHSGGGAMAGTNADGSPATAGTTFLGSHSGYTGLWGAYLHVAELTGGETVWTKDAKGKLQRWQVSRVRYMPHREFPQEYWDKTGPRRLVLTTCGGTSGADGIYNENVFVEAKPVEADGSAPPSAPK